MLGGGGGAGGSLPPGGGGTAKSHLDNTLPDLVREAGYQFTSSLETCRSYLRQWVSSNEILSATVARIIGVMVRTHTGTHVMQHSHRTTTENSTRIEGRVLFVPHAGVNKLAFPPVIFGHFWGGRIT